MRIGIEPMATKMPEACGAIRLTTKTRVFSGGIRRCALIWGVARPSICGLAYMGPGQPYVDDHTFVPSAVLKGWLELGRSDDVHETRTASLQLNVRRQESASQ
jgi:hypothetical protein